MLGSGWLSADNETFFMIARTKFKNHLTKILQWIPNRKKIAFTLIFAKIKQSKNFLIHKIQAKYLS